MSNYNEGLKKWSEELPPLSDYPTAGYEIGLLGEAEDIYMEYNAEDAEVVRQLVSIFKNKLPNGYDEVFVNSIA